MFKRLIAVVFISLVLAIIVATPFVNEPPTGNGGLALLGRPTRLAQNAESYFRKNLAIRRPLRNLNLSLRLAVGQREFDGLFFAENGLIPHFTPSNDVNIHKSNTEALAAFANRDANVAAAIMILPSSSAIYQAKLPAHAAEIQYNQHGYIERLSKSLSGKLISVDVYPSLFAARNDYLYYRTEDMLTSNGGYEVYSALARRLGFSPYAASGFRKQYLAEDYYGSLYSRWGNGGVRADSIALYHSDRGNLFTVTHWKRYESKTYYSLYPAEAVHSGNSMDIILGGRSPKITIINHSLPENAGSLLVLGDRNMLCVLPFLALHYGEVTFVDPELMTDSEVMAVPTYDYTQVLFAFSIENFMNTSLPAKAAAAGSAQ